MAEDVSVVASREAFIGSEATLQRLKRASVFATDCGRLNMTLAKLLATRFDATHYPPDLAMIVVSAGDRIIAEQVAASNLPWLATALSCLHWGEKLRFELNNGIRFS